MKKVFFGLMALTCMTLLAACEQIMQLNISEQRINQSLQKHNHYHKQISVAGLANADVTIDDLTAAIGREDPDEITLSGNAKVRMGSIFGPKQAQILLKMKTKPVFLQQESAIYLKNLEIVDVQIQPEKMASLLSTLIPLLNQSLQNYFNHKPTYVLSSDRSKAESLAKRFAKSLEVKPGELVIYFK